MIQSICLLCLRAVLRTRTASHRRMFAAYTSILSGHSKWASIKHDKAKNDAARSRTRTLLATEITHASRMYGADPKMNTRLADAIARAKKASLPKANIETAIARGQGLSSSGGKLDNFVEECTFPAAGVALLIEVLTDNKQQAKIDIRKVLKLNEAQLANTAYLFEKRGRLVFAAKDGVDEETMMEEAVNAEALDVVSSESEHTVYSVVQDLTQVSEHLSSKLNLNVISSDIVWGPIEPVDAAKDGAELLADLIEKLRDIPAVKEIYTNAKYP